MQARPSLPRLPAAAALSGRGGMPHPVQVRQGLYSAPA